VPSKAQADPTAARQRRSDGELTRRHVLDAVVETILECGYYQASSNKIAQRAGVTWGTLQHQFGSREAMLLDVLNERWGQLQDALATTEANGDTLEERLASVLDVLSEQYGTPSHLALLQVLLDLTQNPNTSADTRRAAMSHGRSLSQAWQPLFAQALGGAADEEDLVRFAFMTLRGYLISDLVASRFTKAAADKLQRKLLVHGVAAAVREEARARSIDVDRPLPPGHPGRRAPR
jgi:AcrR family transcriptional regulator